MLRVSSSRLNPMLHKQIDKVVPLNCVGRNVCNISRVYSARPKKTRLNTLSCTKAHFSYVKYLPTMELCILVMIFSFDEDREWNYIKRAVKTT